MSETATDATTARAMDDVAQAIALLEKSGNFRLLRRFVPADACVEAASPEDEALARTVAVIDTETMGLDPKEDRILEIGYVLARFNPITGDIYRIVGRYNGLEDPGIPIPEHITTITGIRDEDVAGKTFDEPRILADIAEADIVIAHNSPFDRAFLERRFPAFAQKWWACSLREGPWAQMGVPSSKLEFLAYAVGGVFYDAHRALVDAEILLHLLTLPAHDGRKILAHILDASRKPTYRIWAVGAPIEKKHYLKKRNGYQWSDGTEPERPIKAWFKDGVLDLEGELEDLAVHVYAGPASVIVDRISGRERYTDRYTERSEMAIKFATPACPAIEPKEEEALPLLQPSVENPLI